MQAVVFGDRPGRLRVVDRDVPDPTGAQVLTKVLRAGICRSDVHIMVAGRDPSRGESSLGHEYVGQVVAVGPDVRETRVGDRVVSMAFAPCLVCCGCLAGGVCTDRRPFRNAFAQFALTEEPASCRVPEAINDDVAVLAEPLAVAVHALRRAERVDSSVVILGAGSIALLVAVVARRAGANRVVLVARTNRRARQAEAVGAHALLSGPDAIAQALVQVDGPPALVFDCAGAETSLATAIELAAPSGRVIAVGAARSATSINAYSALGRELDLRFSLAYNAADLAAAVPIMATEAPALRSLVTRTVGLGEFVAGFERVAHGEDECKVLLDPWR